MDEGEKKVHRKDHVDRFTIVELTGKEVVIDNRHYCETKSGFWMKDVEGTRHEAGRGAEGSRVRTKSGST